MRNLFGPMVDSPSPREYIHVKTPPEITFSVIESMKLGNDIYRFSVECIYDW